MTMSSGVWSVAGVTLSYGWYADEDLTSLVSSSPTFVPGGAGHIWAVVTAQRAGYADGIVVKDVTVVAP
jgi:hypothetical protein